MTHSPYQRLVLESSIAELSLARHVQYATEARHFARAGLRWLARDYGRVAREALSRYRTAKALERESK